MEEVTVSRDVAAPPEAVQAAFEDVGAFMRAAGFDEVTVADDTVTVGRNIGLAELELTLRFVESDAALTYEQVEGMFKTMTTTYRVDDHPDGATVTASTEFALGGMIGSALDATLIKRQRTNELKDQLAYLERMATDG
ncbi:SRPBCC family protein [Halorhabdus rudnickae]|uniref:SRPBCC family protein n=1 Tax=Halorhabdus rudnickae TaxID=1775544 RepID=UPI0010841D5C|nr:SRPBCC family protein [Halorhabdus rudnickae]